MTVEVATAAFPDGVPPLWFVVRMDIFPGISARVGRIAAVG